MCVFFYFFFIFHTSLQSQLPFFLYFAAVTESQAEVRWQLPRKEYRPTKRSIICNNEKYRIYLTQNINFLHYIVLFRSYKSNICEQTNVSDFKYCTQIYINKHMLCVLYTHNINKISVKKNKVEKDFNGMDTGWKHKLGNVTLPLKTSRWQSWCTHTHIWWSSLLIYSIFSHHHSKPTLPV